MEKKRNLKKKKTFYQQRIYLIRVSVGWLGQDSAYGLTTHSKITFYTNPSATYTTDSGLLGTNSQSYDTQLRESRTCFKL